MADTFWQRIKTEYMYQTQKNWSLSEVGQHWDETTDYDDINEKTYSYARRFVDGFKLCSIKDNSYVLDICSRTGNGSLYFAQRNKIRKVVCADVTAKMQSICTDNLKNHKLNFETKLFSSFPLPFADNEFEAIISFETLEHLWPPHVFISELARVLRPGGELILTCPNTLWEPIHALAAIFKIHHSEGPHRFRSRRYIHRQLKTANLKVERESTTVLIPGGPKPLVKLGEFLERKFQNSLMPFLGLRRIFICRKI